VRQRSERVHACRQLTLYAHLFNVSLSMARQQGDCDQQRARCTRIDCLARRSQHRRSAQAVYVQHPYAQARGRRTCVRHGIRDVVKLHVEKNVETALNQLAY
jgi:hypothetical protein